MGISLSNARLLRQLTLGDRIPFSKLSNEVFRQLLDEKIQFTQSKGRTRKICYLPDVPLLEQYLENHCGISDLQEYITLLESEEQFRSEKYSGLH